jgi:hypothetical protein
MTGMGHNNPPARMTAELVRVEQKKVDVKLMIDGEMHLLAWRRDSFREGEGGVRVLFTVDPNPDWASMNWNGHTRLSGVRLESGEGVLLSYGNLDPRSFKKPETFQEWVKKTMGISY